MIFSLGNRKLPNTTAIWNLPSGKTCPMATEQCKKWCYAKKAEKLYPQVLPFRERNLKLSQQDDFIKLVNKELSQVKNIKQVRIHESGDFYNQQYLNKWIKIAKTNPNIIFYAYTKCYHFNYLNRSKNFIVLLTDDDKKHMKHYYKFNGITRVSFNLLDEKWFNCLMNCKKCNYCYTPSKQIKYISFSKH
jgi:hypothetical protein